MNLKYNLDPILYKRFPTREVMVGNIGIGGKNPIRVQSMTTSDTCDTESTVRQIIDLSSVGCEIVRLTVPSMSSADNLPLIREKLRYLGFVKYIDFAPLNPTNGFATKEIGEFQSAFIHLYSISRDYEEHYFNKSEPFKFYPKLNSSEFWILLQGKNPIQNTMMNNAQIVENCRVLEKKVEEQSITIKELENKVKSIHNVIYLLLGGLFNQETQRATLTNYLRELFPNIEEKFSYENPDTSEWSTWPTTRQGDDNERRIIDLEQQMRWIYENNYKKGEEA
ncbi:MAG: hypothetical protein EBS19_12850, partial [Spirochaetia bacterium]|nr:hypothetical protein [Spirochaetia bacterium]